MATRKHIELSEVTVEDFTHAVVAPLRVRATRLGKALALPPPSAGHLPVEKVAERVFHYAQTGRGGPEIEDDIDELVDQLYTRPIDHAFGVDADENIVVTTPLGAVLGAARARARLSTGQSVPVKELAALASCVSQAVRNAVMAGALRREETVERGRQMDANIQAPEALAWLAARGVPGFRSQLVRC